MNRLPVAARGRIRAGGGRAVVSCTLDIISDRRDDGSEPVKLPELSWLSGLSNRMSARLDIPIEAGKH